MFSLISAHGSGEPLVSYETVLGDIRRTRWSEGVQCRARRDTTDDPAKSQVTPEAKAQVRLKPRPVLPRWNSTIWPHDKPTKC
jgi:hypothetical protein